MTDPRIQAGTEAAHPEPLHWLNVEACKRTTLPRTVVATLDGRGEFTVYWWNQDDSGSTATAFGRGATPELALADAVAKETWTPSAADSEVAL